MDTANASDKTEGHSRPAQQRHRSSKINAFQKAKLSTRRDDLLLQIRNWHEQLGVLFHELPSTLCLG